MNSGAERFNGLMAMLGIVAGIGAYATTGQFIPGIFWIFILQKKIVNRLFISINYFVFKLGALSGKKINLYLLSLNYLRLGHSSHHSLVQPWLLQLQIKQ